MKVLITLFLLSLSSNVFGQERIVSIGGSLTEVIYLLNKQHELVGTDTTSNYPLAAQKTKKVGYARALSAEGILSLNPSVVFLTDEAGPPVVLKQLQEAGVNIVKVQNDYSVEGALSKVTQISKYLGAGYNGNQIKNKIKRDIDYAQTVIKNQNSEPKILFILGQRSGNLLVSGRDTQADSMIKLVGGINPMQNFTSYKPLTPEQIAEVMPDVILLMNRHGNDANKDTINALKTHPILKLTPAVKHNNIIAMEGSYLLGFGPRIGIAAKELAEQIYD